jgi:diketogulonate reductase-like aldo/keto reductase
MSSDSLNLPEIGFGTYNVTKIETIVNAIRSGNTHIDTAEYYNNEHLVKEAIDSTQHSGKIFITTKISKESIDRNEIEKSFNKRLNIFEYIDLLLLHFPSKNCKKDWDTLVELYKSNTNKIGNIGVSNYDVEDLKQLEKSEMMPAYNQIELSPFFTRNELVQYCRDKNIKIIAHRSLTKAKKLNDHVVTNMANKYQISSAELMLKWALKKGFFVIPKSENVDHMKQNLNVKNDLSSDDLNELDKCNEEFQTVKFEK